MTIFNFCLIIAIFTGLDSNEVTGNEFSSHPETVHGGYDMLNLANIYLEYFRFHGVRSVIFVVCKESNVRQQITYDLFQYFTYNGISVRVFDGHDYPISEAEIPTSRLAFPPPPTFRADNNTRRPLKLKHEQLFYKSGILLLEFYSPCARNVLRWCAATENNFFKTNRFWLLFTTNSKHIDLLQDEDIFIPPDGEARVLIASNTTSKFDLIDVYKIHKLGVLKKHIIATEFRNVSEMMNALRHFGSAITYRQNLEGLTFNTGLVIAFPDVFTNIEDQSIRHIDTISKVNNHLTIELRNSLNIRFNTHQMDNYGWRKPNGSFDGLMGMFQRYELDFAQLAIFMRLDRLPLVDFVAETYRIRAGLIFRQPPLSAVANIFALPFDKYVWISILVLMIFTIVVFGLELNFSPHHHDMDVWDCVIFVWGAMCQQGFYVNVQNRSGRIIIFTTFVATLFLFTSFSANIVALLQSPSEAITSLNDLCQSPLEIGVQDTQYNKLYFTESTDPVTNRLYHKKIAPKGDSIFMRPMLGIKKMRSGLFAYQVELQAGYQIISDTFSEPEKCGLKELEPFQLPMIAIPTRKNFPYKELFRRQLRWQREVGLMNREELRWIQQKPKCEGGVSGFVSIGLTECRYALAMYGLGMFLGSMTFLLEISLKYTRKFMPQLKELKAIQTLQMAK